ncbi:MAG: hypothetical protein NTY38_08175 [Acidobacteria bacterium]|nr:hypothetical protein [Acidobacteriota bacterium]
MLDIDLARMERLRPAVERYKPIRRYPSSGFDLSVIADLREMVGVIQAQVAGLAGEGLEAIEFVREYSGPPLAEGKKSVSYRLTVAAADRTLSSEDVGAIRARIIEGMRAAGFDLRV